MYAFRNGRTGEVWIVVTRGEVKQTVVFVRRGEDVERVELLPH